MGFAVARSRWGYDTFNNVLEEVRRARDPFKGRKIQGNTYCRLIEGTKTEPKIVAVRLHRTDVVKFYIDGSRDIYCGGWSTSATTLDRLRAHGGVSIYQDYLPSINGYRPSQERAYFMSYLNEVVPFNGSGEYIHINANGTIDLDTVEPYTVGFIQNSTELRRVMRHLGKVCRLLKGYVKLSGDACFLQKGTENLHGWIEARADVPLDQITLSPYPHVFSSDIDSALKNACDYTRWDIARRKGWVGETQVWKPRSGN